MPEIRLRIVIVIAMLLASMAVACAPTLSLQDSKTIPSYATVVYSRAIQVPADGYCYHSAFVSFGGSAPDTAEARAAILQFTSIVGKGLFVYDIAGGLLWNEELWMCKSGDCGFKPLIEEELIQGIVIGLWPCVRDTSTNRARPDDNWTVMEIEAGAHDGYIRRIADQAKAFGYPIFMRIGSEMNINQGGGRPSFGENASAFAGAWRRIVSVFRSEGAANVIFVWNPNCADIGPNHWTDYYPGDEYVDWVGIDLYQFQPDSDLRTLLQVYEDYGSRKPIAVCEWGANWENQNYTDEARSTFVARFFDAIEARPDIKMITYHFISDFSFDPLTFPFTTSTYRSRISNSRYIAQFLQG